MNNQEIIERNRRMMAELDGKLIESPTTAPLYRRGVIIGTRPLNLPSDLSTVASLARTLMNEHGLGHWVFEFDRSLRRFGCCFHEQTTITLSEKLCRLNTIDKIQNTILHEIAHALAGYGAGHGQKWQRIAVSIGCDGQRCYSSEVIKPESKLVAVCSNCSKEIKRNRRPRRAMACGSCCKRFNGGRFSNEYLLTYRSR